MTVLAVLTAVAVAPACEDDPSPTPAVGQPPSSPPPTATSTPTPTRRLEALTAQLEVLPRVDQMITGWRDLDGPAHCHLSVLGHDRDRARLYSWVLCTGHAKVAHGHPKSGFDIAVVLDVTGTGADTRLVRAIFPHQATLRADIRRLYPDRLESLVTAGGSTIAAYIRRLSGRRH